MQERTPLIFTKEQLSAFDEEVAKGLLAEGMQSLCCVPLMRPKGPLGVFVLASTRQDAFHVLLFHQHNPALVGEIEDHGTATARIAVVR